jgi:phosphoribosylamine-glycine ligase
MREHHDQKILLLTVLSILCRFTDANAEVTLKEIHSDSNNVLVAFFAGDSADVSEMDF